MRTRILAAVLLALGALIAWLAFGGNPRATTARPAAADVAAAERARNELANAPRAAGQAPARAEAAVPQAADRELDAAASAASLLGRVVDASGAPIAGASIEASRTVGEGFTMLDLERRAAANVVARATSDPQGEFALAVELERKYQLDAEALGFAPARITDCSAGQRVEFVLQRAASLFGRVTRREDGSPVEGARVSCWPKSNAAPARQRGVRCQADTDADGNYRLDGIAPSAVQVKVAHQVEASPDWLSLELAPGETRQHDFVLDAGFTIRGRVTDATTGLPIAQAQIGQGWTFEKCVLTDAAGDYVFLGFSPDYAELTARARGYGKLERVVFDPTSGTVAARADFALMPERTAHGRVVDAAGQPVAGAYVAAVASEFGDAQLQRTDWCSATSDERGAFHLVGLRRDLRHSLFARCERYATVVYEFPPLTRETATVQLGDIVLPQPASIAGTVVDAHGRPVPRQALELRGANADRARLLSGAAAETWGVDLYIAQRSGRCDDAGRFAFDDLAPGHYVLSAHVDDNHGEAVTREVNIEAGASVRDVVLVLDRGLSIDGRITVPDAGEMPIVYVSVDPEGQGRSADCEASADGRFAANGLSEGAYTLTAYPYSSSEDHAAGRVFLATKVAGVAAGAHEIVISLRAATRLRGHVVDASSTAVEGVQVIAFDAARYEVDRTSSRADGSFELLVPANEPTELQALSPDDPEDAPARVVLRGIDPKLGNVELRWMR